MTVFSQDDATPWAMLHSQLANFLGGEPKGVAIQPLAIAERASWDTDNRYLNAYRQLRISNEMPTWNPLYIPSGASVPDEFKAFLDQLNSSVISESGLPDADKLKRLDEERWNAQDQLQKNEFFINRQWDRYVANHNGSPPLPKQEWETSFGFSAMRENLISRVETALAAYMREVADAGGELLEVGRALSAWADPRQQVPLPTDELDFDRGEDSWQRWYRAGLGDDIKTFLSTEAPQTIDFNQTETATSRFEERWSASARVGWFGFFGASGGVSNETIKEHTERDTNSVSISFKNVQSFPILRGQWFKGGLISQFRDRMPENFWGPGGRLNLIPTSIVLVHGAKISVETSETVTDYYYKKRTTGGSAGFRFGPFSIGGSGSRTTIHEDTSFKKTDNGFEIEDNSGRAQVLAVVSVRPADHVVVPGSNIVSASSTIKSERLREGQELVEAIRSEIDVNQLDTLKAE